jgi:hypothetical protein
MVNSELFIAHQCFTAELKKYAFVFHKRDLWAKKIPLGLAEGENN